MAAAVKDSIVFVSSSEHQSKHRLALAVSNSEKMASDSGKSAGNAFEWLAGGLFFGGDSSKKKIASIENSKNVLDLLNGIQGDLGTILKESKEQGDQKPAAVTEENPGPTPEEFLAARLARLRFLLYDERRVTSQQESRRNAPPVATAVLQGITDSTMQELMPALIENLGKICLQWLWAKDAAD